MSSVDFNARALAVQAGAINPQSFAQLRAKALPANISRIDSVGHSQSGGGAATYLCDARASAELMSSFPAAVFESGKGRYFRLLPNSDGYITPEQMGCPSYAPGVNQQPFLQAAIDYAIAVGASGVMLTQPEYELWTPLRTGGFSGNTNHTGEPLVIKGAVSLVSTAPQRTTLRYKGPNGGSKATDFQVFTETYNGAMRNLVWRGSAVKILSEAVPSNSAAKMQDIPMIRVENIIFHTDAVGVRDTTWPATAEKPNCWDITNKGIYCVQNRQHNLLYITNVDIVGFLGECIYTGGTWNTNETGGVIGRNLVMKHSNGQALNPNGPPIFDIDGVYAENCGFSVEAWIGGKYGRMVNCLFKDCGGGGGNGGTGYGVSLRSDGSQPIMLIDMTFQNCTSIQFGSFTKGYIRAIDTPVYITSNASAPAPIRDVDLMIDAELNNKSIDGIVHLGANSGAGAMMTENNSIRLKVTRSKEARTNGKFANSVIVLGGSYAEGNVIYVRGEFGNGQVHRNSGNAFADKRVKIVDEGLELPAAQNLTAVNVLTNPTLDFSLPFIRPTFGAYDATGQFAVALPSTANFADGHEALIERRDDFSPLATLLIDGRVLLAERDRVKFVCNKRNNRWDVVQGPAPKKNSVAVDLPAIAAGVESGPFSVPLVGCRPQFVARVSPPATMHADLAITTVKAGTDQVQFWVRNVGAASADMAAASFTAYCAPTPPI